MCNIFHPTYNKYSFGGIFMWNSTGMNFTVSISAHKPSLNIQKCTSYEKKDVVISLS